MEKDMWNLERQPPLQKEHMRHVFYRQQQENNSTGTPPKEKLFEKQHPKSHLRHAFNSHHGLQKVKNVINL